MLTAHWLSLCSQGILKLLLRELHIQEPVDLDSVPMVELDRVPMVEHSAHLDRALMVEHSAHLDRALTAEHSAHLDRALMVEHSVDLDKLPLVEHSVEAMEEFNQPEDTKLLSNHREDPQALESHLPAGEVPPHLTGEPHLVAEVPMEEEGAPRDPTLE